MRTLRRVLPVMWFRRDLRVADNPALNAAAAQAGATGTDGLLPLFIIDPTWASRAGAPRLAYLAHSLRALSEQLGGLHVRIGRADQILGAIADVAGSVDLHLAADPTPAGIAQEAAVARALGERGHMTVTGSPYAIAPGRVRKPDGTRYRVFTPFHRAWKTHGWPDPAPAPRDLAVIDLAGSDPIPDWQYPPGMTALPAGEAAALARWQHFKATGLAKYPVTRDRPDRPGTSLLSTPLRFGEIHPRTLLADLAGMSLPKPAPNSEDGPTAFTRELAWREFFADVLHHRPDTVTANLDPKFDRMPHDDGPAADEAFARWAEGRTGFPLVDAGMRQLRAEGLIHNRVRMVVASFLVKDLHLPWWRGAGHFMEWLLDGDLASNTHNWQWVAGCGADAAPYFRIFNPVGQGLKFDPQGAYVRRYVPELAHLPGKRAHTPWESPDGYAHGYPRPIVDHAAERTESLHRYQAMRAGAG